MCVVVALTIPFYPGDEYERIEQQSLRNQLLYEPVGQPAPFTALRAGEVWRLFTPCLMHGFWMHLIMNMMMLMAYGSVIEQRTGSLVMLLLCLFLAAFSNTAQYCVGVYWDRSYPYFLGMSGVVFGAVWVRLDSHLLRSTGRCLGWVDRLETCLVHAALWVDLHHGHLWSDRQRCPLRRHVRRHALGVARRPLSQAVESQESTPLMSNPYQPPQAQLNPDPETPPAPEDIPREGPAVYQPIPRGLIAAIVVGLCVWGGYLAVGSWLGGDKKFQTRPQLLARRCRRGLLCAVPRVLGNSVALSQAEKSQISPVNRVIIR